MADGQKFFDNLKGKVIAQAEDGFRKSIDTLTAFHEGQRTAEETTTPNPEDLIDSVMPHVHEMRSYLSDVRMLVSYHLAKTRRDDDRAEKLEALCTYVEEVRVVWANKGYQYFQLHQTPLQVDEKCKEMMKESWILLKETDPDVVDFNRFTIKNIDFLSYMVSACIKLEYYLNDIFTVID